VRLLDPAAVSPPVLQLSTEVLRMLNPTPVRLTVLAACGVLLAAGAVGVWPVGGSPVAPSAVAAPVPRPSNAKQLEQAWDDLMGDPKAQTRATVRLSADATETVAVLKGKLRPVAADEKATKKVLADLDSEDAKAWQPAYRSVQYHDPRLTMTVPEVFAEVKSQAGRHRLYHALMTNTPADSKWVVRETYYTYDTPLEHATYPTFFLVRCNPTADARQNIARVEQGHVMPSKVENFYRPEWERADRGITLLEAFATDDAVALLKELAGGHEQAGPTKSAKEALARLKAK
jgi:hypothetical protein